MVDHYKEKRSKTFDRVRPFQLKVRKQSDLSNRINLMDPDHKLTPTPYSLFDGGSTKVSPRLPDERHPNYLPPFLKAAVMQKKPHHVKQSHSLLKEPSFRGEPRIAVKIDPVIGEHVDPEEIEARRYHLTKPSEPLETQPAVNMTTNLETRIYDSELVHITQVKPTASPRKMDPVTALKAKKSERIRKYFMQKNSMLNEQKALKAEALTHQSQSQALLPDIPYFDPFNYSKSNRELLKEVKREFAVGGRVVPLFVKQDVSPRQYISPHKSTRKRSQETKESLGDLRDYKLPYLPELSKIGKADLNEILGRCNIEEIDRTLERKHQSQKEIEVVNETQLLQEESLKKKQRIQQHFEFLKKIYRNNKLSVQAASPAKYDEEGTKMMNNISTCKMVSPRLETLQPTTTRDEYVKVHEVKFITPGEFVSQQGVVHKRFHSKVPPLKIFPEKVEEQLKKKVGMGEYYVPVLPPHKVRDHGNLRLAPLPHYRNRSLPDDYLENDDLDSLDDTPINYKKVDSSIQFQDVQFGN